MAVRIHSADHTTPLYEQKLALTSLTSGGRSVGIVRSRTKAIIIIIIAYSSVKRTQKAYRVSASKMSSAAVGVLEARVRNKAQIRLRAFNFNLEMVRRCSVLLYSEAEFAFGHDGLTKLGHSSQVREEAVGTWVSGLQGFRVNLATVLS
jgi:hypothetical protein